MFEVNKDVDSIAPPSGSFQQDSNSEQRFPSHISQLNRTSQARNLEVNETNQIRNPEILDQDLNFQKFPFRFQVYNQLIKAFSMFYLSFGFIVATSFFIHQIFDHLNQSYDSWNWIGITNFGFIVINSVSIITMKILIHINSQFIKTKRPVNIYLFFLIIVISAALSYLSLIFILLKNIQCKSVLADYLFPISRLFFLITAVIFISDLLNYEIECNEDMLGLFFFYKFTTFLTFVTFINTIVFEFLYSLSNSLLETDTSCNATFTNMNDTMQKYLNVFSLIFFIVSVIICVEPLNQFRQNFLPQQINNENQPLITVNCHSSPRRHRFISKNFSITIVIGVLIFLLVEFIIPIKLLSKNLDIQLKNIKITSNSLPILPYLICGLIDVWLLKLLYESYHLNREHDFNSTYKQVLWTSSFGMVLMVFHNIMVNLDNLTNNPIDKNLALNIIGLFLDFENLAESILQTMTIDYLLKLNWNCEINREKLSRIFNCCVVLISFNIGLFVLDYYDQAGNEIFIPRKTPYNNYMLKIITSVINPLSLIYRIFVTFILWKFCSRMKCKELEIEQENLI